MNDWVIAEWIDEEGRIRAPSYQGTNGKWYRAGVSEYGGPTILSMDGEPVEITKIQGAKPQRRSENRDLQGALMHIQTRQAAIGDSVANLAAMVATSLNRIERDLSRIAGRTIPALPKLSDLTGDVWFSAPMTQPVLSPAPDYKGPIAPIVYETGDKALTCSPSGSPPQTYASGLPAKA